jgi:hypothetical protein
MTSSTSVCIFSSISLGTAYTLTCQSGLTLINCQLIDITSSSNIILHVAKKDFERKQEDLKTILGAKCEFWIRTERFRPKMLNFAPSDFHSKGM